jgi:hypothetical protein
MVSLRPSIRVSVSGCPLNSFYTNCKFSLKFTAINNANMATPGTCEVGVTLAALNVPS